MDFKKTTLSYLKNFSNKAKISLEKISSLPIDYKAKPLINQLNEIKNKYEKISGSSLNELKQKRTYIENSLIVYSQLHKMYEKKPTYKNAIENSQKQLKLASNELSKRIFDLEHPNINNLPEPVKKEKKTSNTRKILTTALLLTVSAFAGIKSGYDSYQNKQEQKKEEIRTTLASFNQEQKKRSEEINNLSIEDIRDHFFRYHYQNHSMANIERKKIMETNEDYKNSKRYWQLTDYLEYSSDINDLINKRSMDMRKGEMLSKFAEFYSKTEEFKAGRRLPLEDSYSKVLNYCKTELSYPEENDDPKYKWTKKLAR